MKARLRTVALGAFALSMAAALHAGGSAPASAAAPDGKSIYAGKCAACHGAAGAGVPGAFPPLARNAALNDKNPAVVINAIVKGLNGPLKVGSTTYNGVMPAWKGQLSNAEMAAVATYVRTSWGNKGTAVTEAQVAAVAK